jgi:hypothetical protein
MKVSHAEKTCCCLLRLRACMLREPLSQDGNAASATVDRSKGNRWMVSHAAVGLAVVDMSVTSPSVVSCPVFADEAIRVVDVNEMG